MASSVSMITSVPQVRTTPQIAAPAKHDETSKTSFSGLVEGLLEKANAPHVEADSALADLAKGKTEDVHGVVLSMVKADMSFRFALEVRNRLTEAYQEIMRMQI